MSNSASDMILKKITSEMHPGCKIIERLHLRGYHEYLQFFNGLLRCTRNNLYYKMTDFDIDEIHNVKDTSGVMKGWFIFALYHRDRRLKGIFLNRLGDDSPFFVG